MAEMHDSRSPTQAGPKRQQASMAAGEASGPMARQSWTKSHPEPTSQPKSAPRPTERPQSPIDNVVSFVRNRIDAPSSVKTAMQARRGIPGLNQKP
jgi:hypothetical protein